MKIEAGVFSHMVVQRTRKNVSEAVFSGLCGAKRPVLATVRKGKLVLKGFAGAKVGMASHGKMSGCLKGLPVGGPYDIELNAGDETVTIKDVLVGDVWLLGGQSNMQGCGYYSKPRLAVDPNVRAFFMNDHWAVAQDPIHNLWDSIDQVHKDINGGAPILRPFTDWGVCPGPAFGNEMFRLTGVPQGLIACAHGGTTMTQWDPKLKKAGPRSLYGAMLRRLKKNGGHVAGMLWYQGCSDANAEAVPLYTARMKEFVAALRRDTGDKSLPFAMVQIARVADWAAESAGYWNAIQDQERLLPKVIKNLVTVPAIDLPLDDAIHISGAGQVVLGARLAQAMQVLRVGRKAGLPPIALKKVTTETVHGFGVVVVEFENVAGKLCSRDRPSGFNIVKQNSKVTHFDIQLEGTTARIRSYLTAHDLANTMIHYGYGTDTYCNITDGAGRPLPVFGPVRVGVPRAITPFVRELRVSALLPSAGKLETLGCPTHLDALQLTKRTFNDDFCSLHPEIAQHGGQDKLVYFACRFSCRTAMPLALVLGYDGPVKAWIDGKLLFRDPQGVNPATADKGVKRFRAAAGEHEVVVALGTNFGATWGIYLRLQRLGVSNKQLIKGLDSSLMPEILG